MVSLKSLILLLTLLNALHFSECIATYSIDLSSEFIKIAIVKPGVPMETALNKESQRKTPSVVYIRNEERLFDNAALNMGIKYPKNIYHSLTKLLAKPLSHPDVQKFLSENPYYEMVENVNGQLAFKHDENTIYTVEELLAMILQHSKDIADNFAEMETKGGIIVIPPYFTQAERNSVIRAAQIAGINVLQLMNSNAAVALNYGIFRRKSFNSTAQYYMFYDVGSTATIATLVAYQVVKMKERTLVVENPQASIIGIGYDRYLGASQFTLRIQQYIAKIFNSMKKTKDVTKVPRAMAKLYKEAGRVLKVLSANTETKVIVENVMDDVDLKTKLTRDEFEEMCKDLFVKFKEPLAQALESAQLPMPTIKEIILMGGGTRIPKFQQIILKSSDKNELGKSVNTDEAAALGAVYQAAYVSPGFRVKNFIVKDANLFPINVEFDRYKMQDNREVTQFTSRLLFNPMNPFPQKKVLTFNKHIRNFHFNVTIGKEDNLRNLFKADITNMTDVYSTFMATSNKYTTDFKGIKAHFALDNSGIFSLSYIEALFERTWIKDKEESTFEKLGNTISNLFGSGTPEDEKKKDAESNKTETSENNNTNSQTIDDKLNNTKLNSTTNSTDSNNKNATKPKPSIEIIHENLKYSIQWIDKKRFSHDGLDESKIKLETMKAADEAKAAHEKAQNELESYIFYAKSLFDNEIYKETSTEAERAMIHDEATKQSEWYDEEAGPAISTNEFIERRTKLSTLLNDIEYRVKEIRGRPDLMNNLASTLNTSQLFLTNLKNVTGDNAQSIYTPAEYNSLLNSVSDGLKWYKKANNTFNKMKLYENPTITGVDIEQQIRILEREMAYLFNKLNIWRNQNAYQTQNDSTSSNSTEDAGSKSKEAPKSESKEDKSKTSEEDKEKAGKSFDKASPQTPETKSGQDDKHIDL